MVQNARELTDVNKVNAFYNSCLRKICNIYWTEKIPAMTCIKTICTSIDLEIKKRWLRWLRQVLHMSQDRISKVPLIMSWAPAGKRKSGRPTTTLRKAVEMKQEEFRLTWARPNWRETLLRFHNRDFGD